MAIHERQTLITSGYGGWAGHVLRGALESTAQVSFTDEQVEQLVAEWLSTPELEPDPEEILGFRAVVMPVGENPMNGDVIARENGKWVAAPGGVVGTDLTADVQDLTDRLPPVEDAVESIQTNGVTGLPSKIPLAQRAEPDGVATLDGTGKIPPAQLPYLAGGGAPPTADSFDRTDRPLSGDIAPDGIAYLGSGSGLPVISGGRYKTANAPGTGYLIKVIPRVPDWMSVKFAVVGPVSADTAPTLGLLINKASDGELTNVVHCIVTGTAAGIQVLDGTGGAALVNLATNPFPGSSQDIGGGVYQLPPGIYTAMIERIGNTVILTDPLGRSIAHTDPRLGSFWGERLDWEIQNNSATRTIEILHIDRGYGRPLRGSGAAHGGRLPLDPITSEAIRNIGGAGNPGFQNSWANFSASSAGCGFWRDALGIVHIQGEIKSGVFASGFSTVFTLPSELDASGREIYRPAQRRKFSAIPQGTVISGVFYPWHVEVAVNGDVQVYGTGLAAPALIGLGDITYRPRSVVS